MNLEPGPLTAMLPVSRWVFNPLGQEKAKTAQPIELKGNYVDPAARGAAGKTPKVIPKYGTALGEEGGGELPIRYLMDAQVEALRSLLGDHYRLFYDQGAGRERIRICQRKDEASESTEHFIHSESGVVRSAG